MDYAVETIDLTKVFSDWWGRNKIYAVDDLNLKVNYNEVYGLLGPNGSGKTTTLKMLLNLLYPTKGKTILLGASSSDPKISARIGYMPEESYLYRYLNARETLNFYGSLFKLPSKIRKMRTESLLDMVGLKAVANRPVGTFSKGMARRIGLAQALINDPELLILDEPTTGLDPMGTRQMKDLVLKLAKRGKTILLCSHLLADVEDICDRISILYDGQIQTEGKVKDLLRQTNKKQITTGNLSDTAIQKIKQLVEKENAECSISSPVEKLETFFIKTVITARKQRKVTSGAVADSENAIADFLVEEQKEELKRAEILDKLVSTDVSTEQKAEPAKAEEAVKMEKTLVADRELLENLTKLPDTSTAQPTHAKQKAEPVETDTISAGEQAKNLLDQLTGEKESQNDEQQKKGNPDKDSEK